MFSLIITIISIALVAALAVATLYYGGEAFTKNDTKAKALKVVNGGAQINGAVEMFKAQKGTVPATLDELVDAKLLQAVPEGTWALGDDYIVASGLSELQCKEANRQLGFTGPIPACDTPDVTGKTACCSTPDEVTP